MKLGDIDKLCLRDYVVGLGWLMLSFCLAALDLLFDYLPIATQIRHSEGFGIGQWVLLAICVVSAVSALIYLLDTCKYHLHYGA